MQAATLEPVAIPVTANSGLSCDDLANKIKVSIGKGDQYHLTAGVLLLEAKRRLPEFDLTWTAFLVGKCQLQKSRSAELIAIAEGRTTVAEVRAKGRERAARHAAKNKEARSSVSNGQSPRPDARKARIIEILHGADDAELSLWEEFANEKSEQRTERDRKTCLSLDSKVTEASRELAQWLLDHPRYS
jgi:hypothetical protein